MRVALPQVCQRIKVVNWLEREAHRIEKAGNLIRPAIPGPGGIWVDLGCGEGIFTCALYMLTMPSCEIYAVDRDRRALGALRRNFAHSFPNAGLHIVQADFTSGLSLPRADGLLLANSLHFVRKKIPLLKKLRKHLKPGGRLIVVEYNTDRGNFAVPYPIDEGHFLGLAETAGLQRAKIVSKIPSSFLEEMYAGLAFSPDQGVL